MRKRFLVAMCSVAMALLTVGALSSPVGAAGVSFGAALDNMSQPNGPEKCDQDAGIPHNATCTWVIGSAFQAGVGNHWAAPKNGTIGKVRIVSCVAGSFILQLARAKPSTHQARIVRSGPTVSYPADPRQVDGDPNTDCGGPNGDDYIVTTKKVTLKVDKGEWIAIKTSKLGAVHCSGGGNVMLFAPPLVAGGSYKHQKGGDSCDPLIALVYK